MSQTSIATDKQHVYMKITCDNPATHAKQGHKVTTPNLVQVVTWPGTFSLSCVSKDNITTKKEYTAMCKAL